MKHKIAASDSTLDNIVEYVKDSRINGTRLKDRQEHADPLLRKGHLKHTDYKVERLNLKQRLNKISIDDIESLYDNEF